MADRVMCTYGMWSSSWFGIKENGTEAAFCCHPPNYSVSYSFEVVRSHFRSAAAGRHPGRDLAAVGESELGQNVLHMVLGRALRQEQGGSDVLVAHAPTDQLGDLHLALGQHGVTITLCRSERGEQPPGSMLPRLHAEPRRRVERVLSELAGPFERRRVVPNP